MENTLFDWIGDKIDLGCWNSSLVIQSKAVDFYKQYNSDPISIGFVPICLEANKVSKESKKSVVDQKVLKIKFIQKNL